MDVNKLGMGEKIAAGAALALLIVMFLGWFGLDEDSAPDLSQSDAKALTEAYSDGELEDIAGGADATSISFSAWESFGFIDIILLITIIAAIGLAAIAATSTQVNLPVALSAVVAGLGILATLLVLYRLIDTPFGFDRGFGVFLGLILSAGIAYGGWRAMQEEGTSFSGEADRLQTQGPGSGGAPPPPPPAGPAA